MLLSGCAGLTITKTESFGIGQLWNKAASLRDCYRNPALHPKLRDNIQNRTVPKVWDFGSLFWIFLIPFLWPGLTFWTLQPLGKVKHWSHNHLQISEGFWKLFIPFLALLNKHFCCFQTVTRLPKNPHGFCPSPQVPSMVKLHGWLWFFWSSHHSSFPYFCWYMSHGQYSLYGWWSSHP